MCVTYISLDRGRQLLRVDLAHFPREHFGGRVKRSSSLISSQRHCQHYLVEGNRDNDFFQLQQTKKKNVQNEYTKLQTRRYNELTCFPMVCFGPMVTSSLPDPSLKVTEDRQYIGMATTLKCTRLPWEYIHDAYVKILHYHFMFRLCTCYVYAKIITSEDLTILRV